MHERQALVLPLSRVPIMWPVMFYDDCEGTFSWLDAGDGADYDTEYAADHMLVGEHCLLLRTKATAPTIADAVSVSKLLWLPVLKTLNLQFAFAGTTAGTKQLVASLYWYDGTNVITATLRFNFAGPTVEYLNAAAGFTAITGATFKAGTDYWNYVSMLVDIAGPAWLPGQVNNVIIQTDTPALPSGADATTPYLLLYFSVTALANARAGIWIDQILLTALNP